MNDKTIINSQNDLGHFFEHERQKNIYFMTFKYNFSVEDAEDIYQDACIALFSNIKSGKLNQLTSKLSTYFTRICINLSLKKLRNTKELVSIDNEQYDSDKVDELIGITYEGLSVRQKATMYNIVSQLPSPCDKILWSYYDDNMSLADIAILINYKNADSVKTKKSQCISKLKNRFNDETKNEFYGED